jgi:hypothetical protein
LAHTFASPCLGREPKVRVATITNIDKPIPTHGLCVLSSSIVEEILAKLVLVEMPFSSMDVEPFIQNLHCFLTCVSKFFTILMMPLKLENLTIECYKTFIFGKGCTKIKTPTSSMVRN